MNWASFTHVPLLPTYLPMDASFFFFYITNNGRRGVGLVVGISYLFLFFLCCCRCCCRPRLKNPVLTYPSCPTYINNYCSLPTTTTYCAFCWLSFVVYTIDQ
ncbi:uncharacterized protein GGS25DRAFT_255919 [Hypoxylon fragiforme]|uniref:uncharacterized protein n=1 Tax=Hypoxylon fragiforme TaxID=63214 RepID=UPI0020C684A7|nr:uncharacterized protein GGS25DRAFT_255919 [Hypoxylon fragiforme]KAI2610297.1 hypothetical protein GGS25DRAFT_255919 [Hypoxylon fragiforme]